MSVILPKVNCWLKISKLFYMYVLKTKLTVESTSVAYVQPWLTCNVWSAHIVRKCTTMIKVTMNIWVYKTILRDSNVKNVMTNFSLTRKYWNKENSNCTKKLMLYTYVNYISHLVFICIQSSEIFKINRICVLFVLMTFLKRTKHTSSYLLGYTVNMLNGFWLVMKSFPERLVKYER